MIGALIGIIFVLIIAGVLWWVAQTLIALVPMGEPFKTIVNVLLVLVGVLVVLWILAIILEQFGVHVGWPAIH